MIMAARKVIAPKNVWDSRPQHYYAQAMIVDNTIYVSGQTAWDEKRQLIGPGDIEAQARMSLENIRRLLEAEGARMSDVVKMIFFTKCRPSRSVTASSLISVSAYTA
jgi:enamine deaminase RidA (YjgF/YER057c/UK114 family)